jgi:hypothetical protein
MLEAAADMNPPDAKGLVLGTSMPIEPQAVGDEEKGG